MSKHFYIKQFSLAYVQFQCQIHFYVNNLFYLKQFILAEVHSLIVENISISNYSSSYM